MKYLYSNPDLIRTSISRFVDLGPFRWTTGSIKINLIGLFSPAYGSRTQRLRVSPLKHQFRKSKERSEFLNYRIPLLTLAGFGTADNIGFEPTCLYSVTGRRPLQAAPLSINCKFRSPSDFSTRGKT